VIEKWIKDGLLIGADKEKALEFASTNGVQFPTVVQQINKSLSISVGESIGDVKNAVSEAFKRLE
jgi:hypothetical protein